VLLGDLSERIDRVIRGFAVLKLVILLSETESTPKHLFLEKKTLPITELY
jgi:hypothetical protein